VGIINYPNKKTVFKSVTSYKNRGMVLEDDLNVTNEYYRVYDIAVIYKKPIPIQVVDVYYPARNKAVIKEAYYKTPSTTDYNGIFQGRYLDFEAKETSSMTSFPLKNINHHQIEHLNAIEKHGGIAFMIIAFQKLGEAYLVSMTLLNKYYQNQNERKSIPYKIIKENSKLIVSGYKPRLDYLKAVKELFFD